MATNQLVNTTEDGVYNHLGDDVPSAAMSSASIYDVTGNVENEYDISQSLVKKEVDHDHVYDDSRTVDHDVYNTIKDTLNTTETNAYSLVEKR